MLDFCWVLALYVQKRLNCNTRYLFGHFCSSGVTDCSEAATSDLSFKREHLPTLVCHICTHLLVEHGPQRQSCEKQKKGPPLDFPFPFEVSQLDFCQPCLVLHIKYQTHQI